MAKNVSWVVTNVKELDQQLRKLEANIGKKIVRKAMRKALKPVQMAVKANAPVGEHGRIPEAVKIRAGKYKKGKISVNVQIGEKAFQGDAWYAQYPEFGLESRDYPAQHYMERASEETRTEAISIAREEIKQGIRNEIKK